MRASSPLGTIDDIDSHPNTPHSYVAGESEDRLHHVASLWGLAEPRLRRKPVRNWFADSVTMHMHSVGALSRHERLDATGTLHYVTIRRRRRRPRAEDLPTPQYETLTDLFQPPAAVVSPIEVSEEEEIVVVVEEEDVIVGGSLAAAMFGIIKGTVGPAILYLPHGVVQSGYVVAIPSIVLATILYLYSANTCLLECWNIESRKQHEMATAVEELLALVSEERPVAPPKPTLLTYPELARRALGPYSILTVMGIAFFQLGVCLTYLIFVPHNLMQLTHNSLPREVWVWTMVLGEIPLGWLSDIRSLTCTNILATFLIAYGLVAVLALAIHQGWEQDPDTDERRFVSHWKQLPPVTDAWFLFVGTSFFMMEGGITLVVPLQEAVSSAADRKRFPAVNTHTTWGIVVFYVLFACICAAGLGGEGLSTALTASLHGHVANSVQLAYSVAVFFSFPLQAFPALQVICRALLGEQPSLWWRGVFTTAITLLLGVIATIAIDYLGNVVSLLGSMFGIPLALVFPPLMHNRLVGDRVKMNYVVVCFGLLAMGAASYATAASWNEQGG
ncbi:solute carrier family 36 [Fistulifera solaris]|uniref:Solute carrier family 36 n=1 Tax=Fistulifera solaris TaxID=1519565 RepID=A0A1Z5JW37_FISSO|nr:solute carrier family 36 [Fistulifera solaris]|eukprot:GAX18257.1 solute carrier family 36 [Fistulifera solaris]